MKFRVLFASVGLFALSTLTFAQPPADCYFEYPMDWDCYSHPPLTSGACWSETPFPDGTTISIKECPSGQVLCTFPMNSLDICGEELGGFFVQWDACVVVSGTEIYLEVEYESCRYWTDCYTTVAGYNYFGLLEADFFCECENPGCTVDEEYSGLLGRLLEVLSQ